ncbi:hypothetical protein PC116_g2927 [Phytophthora cactorum]|nr:hypothetical protein PC116_g2927 [Phytophthora cactorum]
MRRWLEGVIAEVPSELQQAISTGSGTGSDTGSGSTGSVAGTSDTSDDRSLELWLSISIPLVLLLTFIVVMFFCCKRQKRRQEEIDLEAGSPTLPVYHLGRRRGAPNNRMVLTDEDEEALASWRIDGENIAPVRPLGAGAYGTVWLATYLGETVVVKKLSPPMPASLPRTKSWRKNSRHSRQSVGVTGATSGSNSRTRTKSRGSPGESALRRFVAEIRFLATLSHPKIVAFYGVAWSTPSKLDSGSSNNATDLQMVLEFMSGGDLRQYLARTLTLSNGQPLPESAVLELLRTGAIHPSLSDRCPRGVAMLMMECLTLEPTLRPTAAMAAGRLRTLLERERRVSDIGDDVSTSDQNSFLGTRDDLVSVYSSSSSLSIERGFNYAVLEER